MSHMFVTRALGLATLTLGLTGAACGGGDSKDNTPSAVVKFCNPLSTTDNSPLDLTLEIGSTSPVTLTAGSETCTPAAKQACVRVPIGKNIPVVLREGADRLTSVVVDEFKANEEWLMLVDLTDAKQVILEGGPIPADVMTKCADLAFDDIFDTSGNPTPMPSPTPRI